MNMSSEQEHEFPYPYPYYDEKTGKINCQLCGKPFLVISPPHLRLHNVKHAEYKLRFPDAPLSSEEFAVRGLHGKNKDMFRPEEPKIEEGLGEEIVITEEDIKQLEQEDEDESKIEYIKESVVKEPIDRIALMKKRVYNHLSTFFSNIRQDFSVEEKTLGGTTKYSYITDFCDPVLRVIVECPNTFWHNRDSFEDPLKPEKLRQDGWKVIIIKSKAPQRKEIEEAIKGI